MNGVHDMGGMEGLGPVEHEKNEPVFHHAWEGRALGLTLAMGAWKKWNIDASRHARELIPGPVYLRSSYYEKWLLALGEMMVQAGLVTREELESGKPAPGSIKADPPLKPDMVLGTLGKGTPYTREVADGPRFQVGDRVRTRNMHPHGHTRLPRYARGKEGVIHLHHGAHVFPDSSAHGRGENPTHLYSVRITGRELWGAEGGERDAVHLDLWEAYLEPA